MPRDIKTRGHLANIGVHGKSVDFHIEKLWIQNITITTGLVNANSTPSLLEKVQTGKLVAKSLVTHNFGAKEIIKAYEVFSNAADNKALKVIISF